jgi:hypothetical protein
MKTKKWWFDGILMEYSWIEISIDLEIHILMARSTIKIGHIFQFA